MTAERELCPKCGSKTNWHEGHGFDLADVLSAEDVEPLKASIHRDDGADDAMFPHQRIEDL